MLAPIPAIPSTSIGVTQMEYAAKLVGVQFRPVQSQVIFQGLLPGDTLDLVRDPKNQYDMNAIEVHKTIDDIDYFIGFIDKHSAVDAAPLLDTGFSYTCTVMSPPGKYACQLMLVFNESQDAA